MFYLELSCESRYCPLMHVSYLSTSQAFHFYMLFVLAVVYGYLDFVLEDNRMVLLGTVSGVDP